MKILIISDAWLPQLNGVVRTYQYLNKELEKAGHNVLTIGPAQFPLRLPMPGYKEIDLVLMPYKRLAGMIKDFAPDTIHIATEGPLGWAARKYCLKNRIGFTTCYHTQFPDYTAQRVAKLFPFLYKITHIAGVAIIKKFHAPSRALMVTTPSMAQQLKKWDIAAPIYPFTRGIDHTFFKPAEKTLFKDLPRPVALFVGRLAIEKNIEEFLSMEWSGSKVVVGHGPHADILKKNYPQVYFAGTKTGNDLAAHYQSADVFVFPSLTDTFGLVLIEALACGLPVAAHDVIGPRDIIVKDALGVLDDDLSLAATKAMTHETTQVRHKHVIENYSWEKAMMQFLSAQKTTEH